MVTINDLLIKKGKDVWSVTPDSTVLDALKLMGKKEVGALLVLERDKISGIISERDFARSVAKNEKCVLTTPVRDVMTRSVITISSEKSIEDSMKLMTEKHFRHLPVVDHGVLQGMISIGDVVKEVISMDEKKINLLEYLSEDPIFDQ